MKILMLLGGLVWLLGGCEMLAPQVEPVTPPPLDAVRSKLVAKHAIHSSASNNNDHLADLEVWMDHGPTRPRLLLTARQDLVYFDINLALPVCYVFIRPNQEMPGWRGGPLRAGQHVELSSNWEQISDTCQGDYATVLWNMASQYQGSKSKLSVQWDWPE